MIRMCFLLATIYCVTATQAQPRADKSECYVVLTDGDTIYGDCISVSLRTRLQYCTFFKNYSEPKEYTPKDLKAFKTKSGSYYISKEMEEGTTKFLQYLQFVWIMIKIQLIT